MTTAPQPLGRLTTILDHIIRGIAWTTQAGAATLYVAVTFHSNIWQKTLAQNPVSTISVWTFVVAMTALWMTALREEQARFYNRRVRTLQRKVRILGHFSALFIAAVSAIDQKDRIGLWGLMGMAVLLSTGTWAAWLQTRALPAEDQAVIDAIHDREAQMAAAAYDAGEKERRRERLSAIVSSLGYRLTDDPSTPVQRPDANHIRWTIPPGKHAPLVYFIRNGNRIKIGTTAELKRRIRTLALRPENVVLLFDGGHSAERAFHKRFAEHRIGNTEWFANEGTLTDFVHEQISRVAQEGQGK